MKTKLSLPLFLTSLSLCSAFLFTSAEDEDSSISADLQKALHALPEDATQTPTKERKLLVFSRTNGFRHKSIPTGQAALTLLGKSTQAYDVVISDDLAQFEAETIRQYDAICFLNTTGEVFLPKKFKLLDDDQKEAATKISDRLKGNLSAHIKDGAGFIGIHSATDTFYRWPEYGTMIGAYFNGHPWNHRSPVSIKVEPGAENHPLVAHLKGQPLEFKEEIYQLKAPYDSSKLTMLLRLDPEKSAKKVKGIKRSDQDFGVSWIKNHGAGRVFYCSLGHNDHIYTNPKVLQHYLHGIQYALGDLELPLK